MQFKRMVVLANSYKNKPGRCVAGRETDGAGAVGGWLRPISRDGKGELLPWDMLTDDGRPVRVLDTLEIPVEKWAGDRRHPEDWLLAPGARWRRLSRFDPKTIAKLEERPRDLWCESTVHLDRVTGRFLFEMNPCRTLYLIRPGDFRVESFHEFDPGTGRNKPKRRVRFSYNGLEYTLSITDPAFIDRYAHGFPPPGGSAAVFRPPYGDRCLLCISLTPEFLGYHYKIVAAVLELP